MRVFSSLRDSRGVSLVEVLTALVIFLVGIAAVIRVFPSGFATIRSSELSADANRLAQAELDRMKSRSINLPMAILSQSYATDGTAYILTDLDAQDMHAALPAQAHVPDDTSTFAYSRYYSDSNKFRHVIGESTKIPTPTGSDSWETGTGAGSVYVLSFAPIVYNNNGEYKLPGTVTVYSSAFRRQPIPKGLNWADRIQRLSITDPHSYAIDYDNNEVYVAAAAYTRTYRVTYSYWQKGPATENPKLVTVVNETHSLDPLPTGQVLDNASLQKFSLNVGTVALEPASEEVTRLFSDKTPAAGNPVTWRSDDPYEFAMGNTVAGVVLFNPLGYGYTEVTSRGAKPLVANIDYDVLDWHILREERKVPDASTSTDAYLPVRMAVGLIKQINRTDELDGTTYRGIAPDIAVASANNLPYEILATDVQTGIVYKNDPSSKEPSGTDQALKVLNYQTGLLGFHRNLAGHTFQICYRAELDWAVQVYKNYGLYERTYNLNDFYSDMTTAYGPGEREFFVGDGTASGGAVERIYFPRVYANTEVLVDYAYQYRKTSTSEWMTDRVMGDTLRISGFPEYTTLTDATTNHDVKLCYVDLTDTLARLKTHLAASDVKIAQVYQVNGVTLGTRVIWRNTARDFRAGRWRVLELTTYLTRSNE